MTPFVVFSFVPALIEADTITGTVWEGVTLPIMSIVSVSMLVLILIAALSNLQASEAVRHAGVSTDEETLVIWEECGILQSMLRLLTISCSAADSRMPDHDRAW